MTISATEGRFGIIPANLFDDPRLLPGELLLVAALSVFANKDGWAYPSQARLGAMCKHTQGWASEHLKRLADLGIIFRRKRRGTNAYEYQIRYDRLTSVPVNDYQPADSTPPETEQDYRPSDMHYRPSDMHYRPSDTNSTKNNTIEQERESRAPAPARQGEHRIETDWQPDPELRQWAAGERPDLDLDDTIAGFAEYWSKRRGAIAAKKPAGWRRAFREWVRRERPPARTRSTAEPRDDFLSGLARVTARLSSG